jgi:hypothetical protein
MGRNPFYDDLEITNGAGTFFDDALHLHGQGRQCKKESREKIAPVYWRAFAR